jgi:outer membrane receptor protein involved in Fe transport
MRGLLLATMMSLIAASNATAQGGATASIRGRVTDETGGALPGVTIQLTGPALLVPELIVISNAQGTYAFPELPIGLYRAAYELAGFQRLVREEIRLTAGFTAELNITLTIGSVAESVTVSGESPVVDTSSTTPSASLSSQVLSDVIPATRTLQDMLASAPGVLPVRTPDTGGGTQQGGQYGSAYGVTAQMTIVIDGINTRQGNGGPSGSGIGPDMTSLEEVQVVTVAGGAEQALPGVFVNMIVKSGGNDFHGRYEIQGQNDRFQTTNLSDALRAQGVTFGDALLASHETSADFGGRIIRDKLWFYVAGRYQYSDKTAVGFAKAPGLDGTYGTGDDVPGSKVVKLDNETVKITYQPARNYRLSGLATRNGEHFPVGSGPTRFTPFESTRDWYFDPRQKKIDVQGTPTDRIVFNALVGTQAYDSLYYAQPGTDIVPSSIDNASRLQLGAAIDLSRNLRRSLEYTGSMLFLPERRLLGTHEPKIGFSFYQMNVSNGRAELPHGNYRLVFDTVGGIQHQPLQIITYNFPVVPRSDINEGGIYVQDTWRTGNRLTLNLGFRFDSFHTFVPAQTKEQGQFGSAGSFPRLETGTWRLPAPRLGAIFDLTGDGKMLLKGTWGRYNHTPADDFGNAYNKNTTSTTTYRWRDLNSNGDYDPGEVNLDTNGPDFISISAAANNLLNRDLRNTYTRQFTVGVERELMANLGARLSYYNLRQIDMYDDINVLRPYSAYNTLLQRRDPGPDGLEGTPDDGATVAIYDYDPAYRGSRFVGNMRVNRPDSQEPYTQTIEAALTRRTSGVWGMLGSFSAQKKHELLKAVQSPNDEYFNLDDTWTWQARLTGSYEFPWDLSFSGTTQVYSGIKGQRTNLFRALPSSGTVMVAMEPFGATAGPTRVLANVRVAKQVSNLWLGGRLRFSLDVLNLLNGAAPWGMSTESGPTFGQYTSTFSPRILRGGVVYSF